MTPTEAVAFVAEHGLVLERAQGPLPNLVEQVAGESIRGSWWAHPQASAIFRALTAVRASPDVLACRLVNGKVTLIHRRLWPALIRLRDQLPVERLAAIEEEHTPSGRHTV